MKRNKLYQSLVMAGALSGLGVLGGLGAGLYAPTAGAVNLPANGLGEVLIFPYYNMRNNWQTTFSIINTDERNIIAVRLRVAEGQNSRDTRDYTLIMSPGDMFAGVLEMGANGPQLRRSPTDTTCTSPYIPPGGVQLLSTDAFSGETEDGVSNEDGGGKTTDRLMEGYVVAFAMGHSPATGTLGTVAGTPLRETLDTLRRAIHTNNGTPNTEAECTAVAELFSSESMRTGPFASAASVARLFGEPVNVLKGNYSFLNVPRGTAAGGNAVALANFATLGLNPNDPPTPLPAGPNIACTWMYTTQFGADVGAFAPGSVELWNPIRFPASDCPNLIAAQNYPDFLEPTLNAAFPARSMTFENDGSAVGASAVQWPSAAFNPSPYGFLAVGEALRAATVVNEWSINPNLGVSTDWVITHPTKSFHVDRPVDSAGDSPQAAVNLIRFPDGGNAPFSIQPNWDAANFPTAWNRSMAPPIAQGGSLKPFARTFNGKSCNRVGFRLFNVDERSSTGTGGGPVASPGNPPQNLNLCYETNVIPFTSGIMPTPTQPGGVFGSKLLPEPAQLANLYGAIAAVGNAGWMRLDLFADPAANQGRIGTPTVANTLNGPGLPSVGFMIRERAIPLSVIDSYSDAADHTFNRDRP